MNENDWKVSDPNWVKAQEKKWPYFEKRLRRKYDDESPEEMAELEENIKLGFNYITGSITELPRRGTMSLGYSYIDWILMHPNPNEKNIELILKDFVLKGFGERVPWVFKARELSVYCEDLVEQGVVDGAVVEAFMNVVYGHTIEETLHKNSVDFETFGHEMLGSFLAKIFSWILNVSDIDDNCLTPIDRWIDLSKGLLLIVKDSHIQKSSFFLKKFFKFLSDFEDRLDRDTQEIRLDSIGRNREIIADLRNEMITQKKNYCPKLQEYVSKLEVELTEANKL
jgi:hypothetical protein